MDPQERAALQAYLAKRFTGKLEVRARPQKKDSAEVYLDGEFLAVLSKDEEDGELAYHFAMTILDIDLEEG
ncbi:MAG: DUF3126 family protein [Hyphomonadaceae bacterium]